MAERGGGVRGKSAFAHSAMAWLHIPMTVYNTPLFNHKTVWKDSENTTILAISMGRKEVQTSAGCINGIGGWSMPLGCEPAGYAKQQEQQLTSEAPPGDGHPTTMLAQGSPKGRHHMFRGPSTQRRHVACVDEAWAMGG